jgi:hypothetical protein
MESLMRSQLFWSPAKPILSALYRRIGQMIRIALVINVEAFVEVEYK